MKKVIKSLSLIVVIVLIGVFSLPLNTYALDNQTSYVNINTTQNLEVGGLSFDNLTFKDYSSTSTQAFGLTGTIYNNSGSNVNYTSNIYYYDSSYNLVAQSTNTNYVSPGTNTLNLMSNLSILGRHSIDEINYYRLSINTRDSSDLNSNLNFTPSKSNQYKSYDYVIDKYDINVVVNENNTLDITEKITAFFNVPKHGIFRTIPLKNKITRLDGTTSTNRAQISNLSVDKEYSTSRDFLFQY